MIQKFIYGNPIETDAVISEVPVSSRLTYLSFDKYSKRFLYTMTEEDIVYGLGENVRGINKRGWIYKSHCSDDPNHREDTHSLYGAHNFLLIDGKDRFGIFFDTPESITYDIGYTKENELIVQMSECNLKLYLITGETCLDIISEFRSIIGTSYIPPKWAFGYGQSRWSYPDAKTVRSVVKKHRDAGVPLDSVYLDIDYMEEYKDFTINEQRFPDFAQFVSEMRNQGIHLVPIIDAGVKIQKGYPVYEEGVANGYFCKNRDGSDFVAGVWPGRVHFPDMLNAKARKWFGMKYQVLLDQGIDGFWNDMNEPAIFYSEDHLKEVFEQIETYKNQNLDIQSFFDFQGLVSGINNNHSDYQRFYHKKDGMVLRHDRVHNLYGYYMTRGTAEAFDTLRPNQRILLFSRASYIGMHRYGGIWTGDNLSWWSHLLLSIKMMPSLNMCGFLFCGCDLGGFGADTTQDLLLRWLAFGIFTPLMRNHSAKGTRLQEFYQFERIDAFRNIITLRYALIPYLYSEFMKAVHSNGMLFSPLAFGYPQDERAKRVEDQLLVGESIMIAPVYEQNARGRYCYLPEEMKMIRFHSASEYSEEILPAGDHFIEVPLDQVVIFLRKGKVLPLGSGAQTVDEISTDNLTLLGFGEGTLSYELYEDDGVTYDMGTCRTLNVKQEE